MKDDDFGNRTGRLEAHPYYKPAEIRGFHVTQKEITPNNTSPRHRGASADAIIGALGLLLGHMLTVLCFIEMFRDGGPL